MKRSGLTMVVALLAVLPACGQRGGVTVQTQVEAPPATARPMAAVTFVPMSPRVGSVTTEVPDGWETRRTKDLVEYREPGTNQLVLRVGLGDGRQAPEVFLREYRSSVKPTLWQYSELRLTGRMVDEVKQKPYAEWDFTYLDGDLGMRRLIRVYGATFNKPKEPVAWATVEVTVANARFTDARRTFFDHLVDKLRWDE